VKRIAAIVGAVALLLALLVGLGRTLASAPAAEEATPPAAEPSRPEARSAGSASAVHAFPHAMHDPAKREEMRRRLLAAIAAGPVAADSSPPTNGAATGDVPPASRGQRQTNDVEEFGRFVAQAIREDFIPMARSCAKELASRQPDAGGSATVAFELLGDSKIGGIVNSAEVVSPKSTLHDAAFETCIRESLYGVYFDPPPAGGRATLDFDVKLDRGEVDDHVDDFHPIDKR
jgi:hypothetical protein